MSKTGGRQPDQHGPRHSLARALTRVARRLDPDSVPRPTPARRPVAGPPGPAPAGCCLICHSPRVRRRELEWNHDLGFTGDAEPNRTVNICRACEYVAIDEIATDLYRGKTSFDELPGAVSSRMGTLERTGREFEMARMALDILGRKRPQDVLVYGIGRSYDNQHIQGLPGVGRVSIGDVVNVRDDAPFVDANQPGNQRFPIVLASEVVEHFRDPWSDFATMTGLVGDHGLLVCGTNIRGGHPDLRRHRYIFYPDHTSYYSAQSLRRIADGLGFHVDFRLPAGLGGRKRYVLFTRSPEVVARIATYFGRVALAPSEVSRRERERAGSTG